MFTFVLSSTLRKKISYWAKASLLGLFIAYIIRVFHQQPIDWAVVKAQWQTVQHPIRWAVMLGLLTPVNWGLEALKWQILLKRVVYTSFRQAYRGVLAGVSLGFALPAPLGDAAGRVLSLRTHRTEAIGAALVSGGLQFYVALVFGTLAWGQHLRLVPTRDTPTGQWLLGILGLFSLGGVGFGLMRRRLVAWVSARPTLARFASYWHVAGWYTHRDIAVGLLVAAGRYVVFSVQFYAALRLVGIQLPSTVVVSSIGLVFLVKTVAPAFNLLSDLGVREAAALWVVAPWLQPIGQIPAAVLMMATLTLWIVNTLCPVLVGPASGPFRCARANVDESVQPVRYGNH